MFPRVTVEVLIPLANLERFEPEVRAKYPGIRVERQESIGDHSMKFRVELDNATSIDLDEWRGNGKKDEPKVQMNTGKK